MKCPGFFGTDWYIRQTHTHKGRFLNNLYIQIKNLYIYRYELVRAAKPSELKRCSKYRRNDTNQCTVNYLRRIKSKHLHDLLDI